MSTTSENIKYYPNGQVKVEVNLKDGMMYGPYKEYYSNGALYIECNYGENGKLNGEYKEYDTSGHLIKKSIYVNGKC